MPPVGSRPALAARPVKLAPSGRCVRMNRLRWRGPAVNPDQQYQQIDSLMCSHCNVPGTAMEPGFATTCPLGPNSLPCWFLRLKLRGPTAAGCPGLSSGRTGWWPCSFLPLSPADLLPIVRRLRGFRSLLRVRLEPPPPQPAHLPLRSRMCLWNDPLSWVPLAGCRRWPLSVPRLASAS